MKTDEIESSVKLLQWLAVLEGDRCAFTRCEEHLSQSLCDTDEGVYRSEEDGLLRLYLRDGRERFNLSDRAEEYVNDSIRFAQPIPNKRCIDPRGAVSILASEGQTSSPVSIQFASKLASALGIPHAESVTTSCLPSRVDSERVESFGSTQLYADLVLNLRLNRICSMLADHLYANAWKETLLFVDDAEDFIARMYGFLPSYNGGRTLRNLLAEIGDWARTILTLKEGTDRDACLRHNCAFFAKEIDAGFGRRGFARAPCLASPYLPRHPDSNMS